MPSCNFALQPQNLISEECYLFADPPFMAHTIVWNQLFASYIRVYNDWTIFIELFVFILKLATLTQYFCQFMLFLVFSKVPIIKSTMNNNK